MILLGVKKCVVMVRVRSSLPPAVITSNGAIVCVAIAVLAQWLTLCMLLSIVPRSCAKSGLVTFCLLILLPAPA